MSAAEPLELVPFAWPAPEKLLQLVTRYLPDAPRDLYRYSVMVCPGPPSAFASQVTPVKQELRYLGRRVWVGWSAEHRVARLWLTGWPA